MRQNDSRLTPDDREALREVAKGAMQRILPDEQKARLVELGLVRIALGGPMLTTEGRLALEFEKGGAPLPAFGSLPSPPRRRR